MAELGWFMIMTVIRDDDKAYNEDENSLRI